MAGAGGSESTYVKPVKAPSSKTIDWKDLVAAAEGGEYRARQPYAVYVFDNGVARRIFTEDV
jgi:hypothetical protein